MTTIFAAKAAPAGNKLRGGYYTPQPLARFVAGWVAQAGPQLLEPSCGDGAILEFLNVKGRAVGIELFPDEAIRAAERTGAEVITADFFEWFSGIAEGEFDGVAGNPPYIRFGSWDEKYREPAFELMRRKGLHPSRLTNAWLPFVVAAVAAVRNGGRIGLVRRAELLQVSYAAVLRACLVDSWSEIAVVSFAEPAFPGILQEVIVLLAVKGEGPASLRTVEVSNGSQLHDLETDKAAARAPLHEREKWTKYFLSADQIETMRALRDDPRLSPLRSYAAVNVGVVTGRNSFFCLTETEAKARNIHHHTIGLVSRSAQLESIRLNADDLGTAAERGLKTRLLALQGGLDLSHEPDLERYVKLGEDEDVHRGYKCSIRSSWWSVPSVSIPDGFMLRQVSKWLRVSANDANATSTDTVHRVFTKPGVAMEKLAVATLNSVTLAFAEIMGRSYGGGLLELEPSECVSLPIPDPALIPDELVDQVDELLRADDILSAIRLVDRVVLGERLRISEVTIDDAAGAGSRLRERRLARGRKSSID